MELIITNRKGRKFIVLYDECDKRLVMRYTWHITKENQGYARTTVKNPDGTKRYLLFHRAILKVTDGNILIDHVNGNTLDNRRCNLRKATNSENQKNKRGSGESKFLGVCKSTGRNKWQATIKAGSTYKMLGRFDTQEEAALVYDNAAKIYHGEFARLNFPA